MLSGTAGFAALLAALNLSPALLKTSPSLHHPHQLSLDFPSTAFESSPASDTLSTTSPLNASFCTVEPYIAPPPDIANPPFSQQDANIYRYRRQHAVNLGSWFVHEDWMTPSLFKCANGSKVSELDIATGWQSAASARSVLEKHWDTFIKPSDFAYLAQIGINTVRLPIGYWSLGPEFCAGTPFDSVADVYTNSWGRVLQAISRAGRAGIGVLVDLHGAVGSQNGQPHSGVSDRKANLFDDEDNIRKTIEVLRYLVQELRHFSNVVGIQILNEPKNDPRLYSFYDRAMEVLRGLSSLPLYLHDGFNRDEFALYNSRHDWFSVHDHHSYFVFADHDNKESASGHTKDISTSIASDIAASSRVQRGNMVIGEWSCALTPKSLENESDPEAARREFCTGQLEVYANTTGGWMFWSYLKENCDEDLGWCFKAAVGRVLPSSFHSYPNIASMALDLVQTQIASLSASTDNLALIKRREDGSLVLTLRHASHAPHTGVKHGNNIHRHRQVIIHQRRDDTGTPMSSSYEKGRRDGIATAFLFATRLSRLGFVDQCIRDACGAPASGQSDGSSDEYRSGYLDGLRDGEAQIETIGFTGTPKA